MRKGEAEGPTEEEGLEGGGGVVVVVVVVVLSRLVLPLGACARNRTCTSCCVGSSRDSNRLPPSPPFCWAHSTRCPQPPGSQLPWPMPRVSPLCTCLWAPPRLLLCRESWRAGRLRSSVVYPRCWCPRPCPAAAVPLRWMRISEDWWENAGTICVCFYNIYGQSLRQMRNCMTCCTKQVSCLRLCLQRQPRLSSGSMRQAGPWHFW